MLKFWESVRFICQSTCNYVSLLNSKATSCLFWVCLSNVTHRTLLDYFQFVDWEPNTESIFLPLHRHLPISLLQGWKCLCWIHLGLYWFYFWSCHFLGWLAFHDSLTCHISSLWRWGKLKTLLVTTIKMLQESTF